MSKFLNPSHTDEFYAEHKGKPFFADLSSFMQSDVATGMELVAENAIGRFREVLGPTNSATAKAEAPNSLRALFGTDNTRNACHGSANGPDYSRESELFFGKSFAPTAAFNNCTCCVIKPHIVQEGKAGQVIDMIL